MVMITVEVNLECAECGEKLCALKDRKGYLQIAPCDRCLDDAYYDGSVSDGE